jgi:ariadne-1
VEVGWKQCPACGTMVEKNAGCQHMTCPPPCGHEFCWVCTGPWPRCRCRQ